MRVISGTARGLKLLAPEGLNTRPTTDRVKESVFNILMPYLPCDKVLDLFAGSGAMGIEALSRGCAHCTFIEKDSSSLDIIQKNVQKARVADASKILKADALDFLKSCKTQFDTIFLDPPYNQGFLAPVFEIVNENNLLSENGIIVCETEDKGETVQNDSFVCIRQAKYGKTIVSFYKKA